jgi:predicted lipid-binding transport protein (Tim44 family)
MSRFAALLFALLAAAPALAQTDDLGSEQQTDAYGRLFAGVGIVAVAGVAVLVTIHFIRSFLAEASRGKTGSVITDLLDDETEKKKKKKSKDLYLGEKVPDWKTKNRLAATEALLTFLAKTDDAFRKKKLTPIVTKAYFAVKEAIEERSAKNAKPLVTPGYLEKLRETIQHFKTEGERRVFGDVEVMAVEIVHVEAPAMQSAHTFTALVSARSQDCIRDGESGKLLRGDKNKYTYQEFLTFRRAEGGWLLDGLRPSGDMDVVLNAKNVLEEALLAEFKKTADPELMREFVGR